MFHLVAVDNDVPPLVLPVAVLSTLAMAYDGGYVELCGFLSGPLVGGCASVVVFLENTSPTPETHYEVSNDDLMLYAQVIENESLHTFASFHSHVQHGPYPSQADRQQAPPDLPYQVIIGTGPSIAAYVGDFSLPAAIIPVDHHVRCMRCMRVDHLDHNVPIGTHHLCKGELS